MRLATESIRGPWVRTSCSNAAESPLASANRVKNDKVPADIAVPEKRGRCVTFRPRPETADGTVSEDDPLWGEEELLRGLVARPEASRWP